MSDNGRMITLIAIAVPLAVMGAVDALALKYGADTRPGFDERRPLLARPRDPSYAVPGAPSA